MSVDRRWKGTSAVRIRILAAGIVLLGAGCAVLGWGSRHVGSSRAAVATVTSDPTLSPFSRQFQPPTDLANRADSIFAGLPLFFEPNQGQFAFEAGDSRAKFVNRGAGYSVFLGSEGAILSLASHERQANKSTQTTAGTATRLEFLEMKLAGANPHAVVRAADPATGESHYFIGNDPSKWRQGVPHFARVRYEGIYPGINLVFYGRQGQLEYDFQVAPGADPAQAQLEFDGAKQIEIKDGALVLATERGSVRLESPRVYQEVNGTRRPVEAAFVLRGSNRAGFALGEYDRSRELIIDPTLNFATYFGGNADEGATSVAVDGNLNIYLAGSTMSPNLPVINCGYPTCTALNGAQNVYVAKLTPPLGSNPAALQNVTYLGGSGTDTPVGIAVDGGQYPYVAGTTSSTDFPTITTNAYQSKIYAGSTGTTHVFVTRLKQDFSQLMYSSYLSGNGTDAASGMTIDPNGRIYVMGTTTSNNTANAGASIQFPASTIPQGVAFQAISNSATQFFVTKVDTNASGYGSIAYSTYFGGANFNPPSGVTGPTAIGGGIAVDITGDIYFTGKTNFTYTGCSGCATTDFPILDAYQPCLDTPPAAVIVNPQACTPSTSTTSADAFVAKLNPSVSQGQQLLWSTYLGGTGDDGGVGIALDIGAANVYVVGTTNSGDFINTGLVSTFAAFQKCLNNTPFSNTTIVVTCSATTTANDAFVARLTNPTNVIGTTATNVAVNYFSYLGGAGDEAGTAITVDSNSGAVITGSTASTFTANTDGTFPLTPNPSSIGQSNLTGAQDAFIARLNTSATVGQATTASWAAYYGGSITNSGAPSTTSGTGIALDVNQNAYVAGITNSKDLSVPKALQPTNGDTTGDTYDAFVAQLGTAVSLSIEGTLTLGTNQAFISAGNAATFTYTITNNGPDLASNITISADLSPGATFIPLTNISASISSGTCGGGGTTSVGISCGPISLQSGSTATLTITATPTANSTGASPESFNGGTISALAPGNIVLAQTSVSAQMSDFGMQVSPANQNISKAGDTASYSVQLTPHPLFNSAIALSCTGAPTGSSCSFSPAGSITLEGASGSTATLSIPTVARPITPATGSMWKRQFYALWLIVPGWALIGAGGNRRRRIAGLFLLCVVLGLVVILPSCSHGTTQTPPSGTQAGTYTITVTASSGTDSKSQTITLNVP